MDEENYIQGNKALGSENHADGEVHESSRAGETNTHDDIQQTKPEAIRNNVLVEESRNLVDEELLDKTVEAIKCSRCNRERKIYSIFLCKSCYNYLHLNKEKHKANVERWMEKNPNYFKDYWILKKIKLDKMKEKI